MDLGEPIAVATTDVPPMWFTVPEGFHGLPLGATPEERAQGAAEMVRSMFPDGDDALWTPAAPYYAAIGEVMSASGLAYAAMGFFTTEEGVAHCSFSVAAVESGTTDPDVAANGVRAILESDPLNDVRWIDLPCGPAVACISLTRMTVPADLAASGEETILHTGRIEVHVPFSTGPYTAVFGLDTMAVEHWGDFCDMMVAILRTVSFTEPPPAYEDIEVIADDGRPLDAGAEQPAG